MTDLVEAHGIGGGSDLPISASLTVLAGASTVVATFALLLFVWTRPRFENPRCRALPRLGAVVDSAGWRTVAGVLGLAATGFGVACLVLGTADERTNPVFGFVYVLLWVGLIPGSLLFGPAVKAFSPGRAVYAVASRVVGRRAEPDRLPAWVGVWPASLGLLAFAWLELVSPAGLSVGGLAVWFGIHAAVLLGGSIVFGERWFAAADPFEAYSTVVSRLSPWTRDEHGTLALTSPLRNLAATPASPGLAAVVTVLLGAATFDSFRDTALWVQRRQEIGDGPGLVALETAMLIGFAALIGLAFVAATGWPYRPHRDGAARLAASLVPIAIGYAVAHYLSLFVETGQQTLILASDPWDKGADLFGLADRQVSFWLSLRPDLLASLKAAAIVVGHILGVVAAHDRSLTLLPGSRQTSGQLPLLAVMVVLTLAGLGFLFYV